MEILTFNAVIILIYKLPGELMKYYIGIDYGTSSCKLAVAAPQLLNDQNQIPKVVNQSFIRPDGTENSPRFPSQVLFLENKINGNIETKIGYEAVKYLNDPSPLSDRLHSIVLSPKMDLGKGLFYPLANKEHSDPVDLVTLTLDRMISEFENTYNCSRHECNIMVTVPSSFGFHHRAEIISAISNLGLDIAESNLIDEPSAALLGFIDNPQFNSIIKSSGETQILIIDFGAGTCDVSLLSVIRNSFAPPYGVTIKNLAINDYTELGGNQIDFALASKVVANMKVDAKAFNLFDNDNDEIIKLLVKNQLLKLSTFKSKEQKEKFVQKTIQFDQLITDTQPNYFTLSIPKLNAVLGFLNKNLTFKRVANTKFTSDEFTNIVSDMIDGNSFTNLSLIIENVLAKSNTSLSAINAVLCVGGSSSLFKIDSIKYKLTGLFNNIPIENIIFPNDPDLLISRGAAIECFNTFFLNTPLIRPIYPSRIEILTADEGYVTLIDAGKPLPIPNHEDPAPSQILYPSEAFTDNREMFIPIYMQHFNSRLLCDVWKVQLPEQISVNDSLLFQAKVNRDKCLTVEFHPVNYPEFQFRSFPLHWLFKSALTQREIFINELRQKIRKQKKESGNIYFPDLVRLTLAEYHAGYYVEAEKRCIEFLQLGNYCKENNAELLNVLGLVASITRNKKDALSYYLQAAKLDPVNSTYQYNVGVTYLWSFNNFNNANIFLQKSADLYSGSFKTHFYLAETLIKNNKSVEAKMHYRKTLEIIQNEFHSTEKNSEFVDIFCGTCDSLDLTYPAELQNLLINKNEINNLNHLDQIPSLTNPSKLVRVNPSSGESFNEKN